MSEVGVAFPTAGDDAGRPVVTAAEKIRSVPDSKVDTLGGKVNKSLIGADGDTPIFNLAVVAVELQSILHSSQRAAESTLESGFSGIDWNSAQANPKDGPRPLASVVGTVIHYLVGTWDAPDSSSTKKKAGIINNEIFKLVGSTDGGTGGSGHPPIASPNGKYRVFGELWFDLDGVAECYGGDKGDKSVTRTAITDDGMASGSASEQVSSERLLVITGLGSLPDTDPTVEDSDPPIGIVEIELRLVWTTIPGPSV